MDRTDLIEGFEQFSLSVSDVEFRERVDREESGMPVLGEITVLASAPTPGGDFQGHTVSEKTVVEPLYPGRPIPIYWNHNYDEPPVGHAHSVAFEDGHLLAQAVLVDTARGRDLANLIRAGTVWGASVGFFGEFSPIRTDRGTILHVDRMRLVEISLTTMPVNPHAGIVDYEIKAVVPYQDWPIHPDRKRPWDADEAEKRWRRYVSEKDFREWGRREWDRYRKGFILYDRSNPQRIGSYKLLIVDVVDGKPYAIWRGITAAANAVANPRTYRGRGLEVFDRGDIEGARRHLARYYRKAREMFDDPDIIPPWENRKALVQIFKILAGGA